MQQILNFNSKSIGLLKKLLVGFARKFDLALILDSNSLHFPSENNSYAKYDLVAGFLEKPTPSKLMTRFDELHKIDKSLKSW